MIGYTLEHEKIIKSVQHWVESFVIALNLCPFAKQEWINNRVRLTVSPAETEAQLLTALQTELVRLNSDKSIETTLIIHPNVLQNFNDYNTFLDDADGLLIQMKLDGVYQIASFHPDYQFADSEADDVENYTNKSPYPLLHLIREDSLEQALAHYPNPDKIPERNITLLKNLGRDKMLALYQSHFKTTDK